MPNSADPDQLASSELIWIYTVCKGRVYTGSAGQGLILFFFIFVIGYNLKVLASHIEDECTFAENKCHRAQSYTEISFSS